jgi:hypothetical protein
MGRADGCLPSIVVTEATTPAEFVAALTPHDKDGELGGVPLAAVKTYLVQQNERLAADEKEKARREEEKARQEARRAEAARRRLLDSYATAGALSSRRHIAGPYHGPISGSVPPISSEVCQGAD